MNTFPLSSLKMNCCLLITFLSVVNITDAKIFDPSSALEGINMVQSMIDFTNIDND